MSFVRWLRKNNTKLMAVVVIVIMFGFVGGSYLSYLGRRSSPYYQTIAHYLDDVEINQNDLSNAQNELEVLQLVGAGELLRAQDIEGIFLAELLFAAKQKNPDLVRFTRQIISRNGYRISGEQVAQIYQRSMPPSVYWLLLKNEAKRAGMAVTKQEAAALLNQAIPVLFEGADYSDMLRVLMKRGTPEDAVLEAYSNLLAVLQYGRFVCGNEDLTTAQMATVAAHNQEVMDVNLVQFDTEAFIADANEPDPEAMSQQFDRYKNHRQGYVSDENPYGFGYELPPRVRLEYLAIKLEDVKAIIPPTTQEEVESYYQTRKTRFAKQSPSDVNDPNEIEFTPFAEVAQMISDELTDKKIYAQADALMEEAKVLTEMNIYAEGYEPDELADEQFKELAGDYSEAAEQLSQGNNIKVYTGKTGLLTPTGMDGDEYLGSLVIEGYGFYPVRLAQVVFAVNGLELSELGPFDAPTPAMYENIGPARDLFASRFSQIDDTSRQVFVLVRVVEAEPAQVPDGMDHSFETHTLVFDPNDKTDEHVYSVAERVAEDVQRLAKMEEAGTQADAFLQLAGDKGWDEAVDEFNRRFPKQDDEDPNAAWFSIEPLKGMRRSTAARIRTTAVQNQGQGTLSLLLQGIKLDQMFSDLLYGLIPEDETKVTNLGDPVEFKPAMSYFCIRDLAINRLWKENFARLRPVTAHELDKIQAQSLSAVHYNPENIVKRMRWRWVPQDDETADANAVDVNMIDGNALPEDEMQTPGEQS